MRYQNPALILLLLLASLLLANRSASAQQRTNHSPGVEFISATELKDKLARNERIAIIDVRGTSSYVESTDKIRGAIHVKLRRLRSRLQFPPFKDIPRDSEVVTYCACAADEASIRAAQILVEAGFKHVRALKGGWQMWLKIDGPVDQRPRP